jgi:hypothetical protein
MIKYLYLYEHPFTIEDKPQYRADYISDTIRFTDYERDDEHLVRSLILKFMTDHDLIKITEKEVLKNSGKNTSSIPWLLHWHDFRNIVSQREFDDMLLVLETNNAEFVIDLINLYSRIGMVVDHRLLNTLITRVMRSIQTIPYRVDETDRRLSWETIYETIPWIWILIMIQSIINSDTKAV